MPDRRGMATQVIWRGNKCMGCRMCMVSCPFDIPKFEYSSWKPRILKCDLCYDRTKVGGNPVCVDACPAKALTFGTRRELLQMARARIEQNPGTYSDHIYGEHEAGGTGALQLVNPALVMLLIPLTTGVVYPLFKRLGWELTPLRRMPIGMALAATSFVIAGLLNVPVAAGQKISILWQALPYVVLTVGEIMVSVTGLEFAYTQAPLKMKSVIQSFWNLTTAAANLAVALASAFAFFKGMALFFYYAAFAYLAAAGLALVAPRY